MTTATLRISTPLPEVHTAPRKSWFARFFAALVEAQMRRAMREIKAREYLVPEHILTSNGYKPTVSKDASLPFTR